MLHGTGLKIKIIEALSYGLPVISLPSGLTGLKVANQATIRVETPVEFANAVISLTSRYDEWLKVSRDAVSMIEQNYSLNAVYNLFDDAF